MQPATDSTYLLTVADTGIGIPKDFDLRKSGSLGLRLVTTLTDQLGGTVEIHNSGGTEFKITFAELKYKERG